MAGRAKGGKTPADDLSRLIEQQFANIYRACRALTDSPHDADDAAQETFLRILQAKVGLVRSPSAWSAIVARHACGSLLRRRLRRNESSLDEVRKPVPESNPYDDVDNVIDFGRLIDDLPPRERRALRLLAADVPREDVARDLGVKRPT